MEFKKLRAGIRFSKMASFVVLLSLIVSPAAHGQNVFETWLSTEAAVAVQKLLLNVSPPGTAPGCVVASPSQQDPNYFYNWVRDAALTMSVVEKLYEVSTAEKQSEYLSHLNQYVDFVRAEQFSNTLTGLGEPKFYVNGQPFSEPWGRPQNDGPALRALTLIHFARALLRQGQNAYVQEKLYAGEFPAQTAIKMDLEYVAQAWKEKSFDLWEEQRGLQFYTQMVQQAALLEGAELAKELGDVNAAQYYQQQAQAIESQLSQYWNPSLQQIMSSREVDAGATYKTSGLDTAVVLASLHTGWRVGAFSPADDRILATASRLEKAFASLYPINSNTSLGTAIGRYPEDVYYGGNPWVLTTLAFAELHYRVSRQISLQTQLVISPENLIFFRAAMDPRSALLLKPGMVIKSRDPLMKTLIQGLVKRGDLFLARVHYHEQTDGGLSEQIRKDNGYMTSAYDLTWNYAAYLMAVGARTGEL